MLKIQSPLPEDVEQLMHDTIGCCIAVHRELGPGLRERIYSRAACIELDAAGIKFAHRQVTVNVPLPLNAEPANGSTAAAGRAASAAAGAAAAVDVQQGSASVKPS